MVKAYDYLIVGSGLFGATFAFLAHKDGKKCLVIDKRPHLGGNIHCEEIEGINVHSYGAHIFHTDNRRIWDFVNSFVPFNHYINSPLANYKGRLFNLPFNMNTFHQVWGVTTPEQARKVIEGQKTEALTRMLERGTVEPGNLEEQAILLVGRDIFEMLVKGYTEKHWGRHCKELPAFIIKRLPVRFTYDNNYFDDTYQGIPEGGYNKLIDGLLKGVECRTGTDFFEDRGYWESLAETIVYTGPIDKYFGYRLGQLDWRSIRFELESLDIPNYQGNAIVNYTDLDTPYTRVIEHKHFENFGQAVYDNRHTVISREYSTEWKSGGEPFYPVNDEINSRLYLRYKRLADAEKDVVFGGRLAEYKYYDMAPIIERAMELYELQQE